MSAWSALAWSSRVLLAAGACALVLAGAEAVVPVSHAANAPQTAPPTIQPAKKLTCATCHLGDVRDYAHAGMRNAMLEVGKDPALNEHTNLTVTRQGFIYTLQTQGGRTDYTVSDGTHSLTVPVQWILGQNSQTFVLVKDGHIYESLVSYFALTKTLATTPGDDNIVPHTLTEAIGRKLSIWEVRNCFRCHTSGYNPDEPLVGQKLTPGVSCDRCHVGAQKHMADAERGIFTSLPKPLGKMDALETSSFCGRCHRTWDTVVRESWHGTPTVRFQPYRLENSKCFNGHDKRIGCLACHNPHEPLSVSETHYDSKCIACHSPAGAADTASAPIPKMCPVSKKDCVSCHMPKVGVADGNAIFFDHQIRIARPGAPYPD